jgi:hypothetical protein
MDLISAEVVGLAAWIGSGLLHCGAPPRCTPGAMGDRAASSPLVGRSRCGHNQSVRSFLSQYKMGSIVQLLAHAIEFHQAPALIWFDPCSGQRVFGRKRLLSPRFTLHQPFELGVTRVPMELDAHARRIESRMRLDSPRIGRVRIQVIHATQRSPDHAAQARLDRSSFVRRPGPRLDYLGHTSDRPTRGPNREGARIAHSFEPCLLTRAFAAASSRNTRRSCPL